LSHPVPMRKVHTSTGDLSAQFRRQGTFLTLASRRVKEPSAIVSRRRRSPPPQPGGSGLSGDRTLKDRLAPSGLRRRSLSRLVEEPAPTDRPIPGVADALRGSPGHPKNSACYCQLSAKFRIFQRCCCYCCWLYTFRLMTGDRLARDRYVNKKQWNQGNLFKLC